MPTYTEEEIRECARRGALFMDEQDPQWHHHINSDILDIGDPNYCPLGQKFGNYVRGGECLKLSNLECFHLGFIWLHPDENNEFCPSAATTQRIPILNCEWCKEIALRRERDKQSTALPHDEKQAAYALSATAV